MNAGRSRRPTVDEPVLPPPRLGRGIFFSPSTSKKSLRFGAGRPAEIEIFFRSSSVVGKGFQGYRLRIARAGDKQRGGHKVLAGRASLFSSFLPRERDFPLRPSYAPFRRASVSLTLDRSLPPGITGPAALVLLFLARLPFYALGHDPSASLGCVARTTSHLDPQRWVRRRPLRGRSLPPPSVRTTDQATVSAPLHFRVAHQSARHRSCDRPSQLFLS